MSKLRVVIQARTESVRLPGKALLPIAGIPSAILAARRAANQGHDVVLATSSEVSDDILAATARNAGLMVFRGSRDDVRGRFLKATEDLADQDIIVRLTADNMLPDGSLLTELLTHFRKINADYLSLDQIWHQPPYGLSCEVFFRGALKKSSEVVDTPYEREHVTPALRNLQSSIISQKVFTAQESALRVTMDNFADYQRISKIFTGIADPIAVSWRALVARLAEARDAPVGISPGPGFVLGTAQLAAPYGSVIKVNPPESAVAIALVRQAIDCGALALDTARDYSGSEAVIGQALAGGWSDRVPVITKLSALQHLSEKASATEAALAAEMSVFKSMYHLGDRVKPYLLLHRVAHLEGWGGAIMDRLLKLRAEGIIRELGVSVQTPEEAQQALDHEEISLLQLPYNVLDKRWDCAGLSERLTHRPGVKVYVRSTFLQGILLRDEKFWPKINEISPVGIIQKLKEAAKELNRDSVADLCIAYVRAQPWITGLVIGMENLQQLRDNIQFLARPALTSEEANYLDRLLPDAPERLVNPALWPRANA